MRGTAIGCEANVPDRGDRPHRLLAGLRALTADSFDGLPGFDEIRTQAQRPDKCHSDIYWAGATTPSEQAMHRHRPHA